MLKPRIKELVTKAAKELDIPRDKALSAYVKYWMFIKQKIEEMPLDGITEEEFGKLRPSISIPNIGHIYTTYKRIQGVDKSQKIINERAKNKKRKTTS